MRDKKEVLRTEELAAGYNGKAVISGVDISVSSGEILSIIGKNAEGKSTILKTLSGLLKPVAGKIYINEKDREKMAANELSRAVSILLTDKPRAELMSCADVVASARYPYTGKFGTLTKADIDCVEEAMRIADVEKIKNTPFACLSDGQKQRVMLSRAICQDPQVIIMDEPTSFLDIAYKLEFMALTRTLAKEKNIAVIMTIHDLEIAEKLSDKVVCLKNGKVDRTDTPQNIFTDEYIIELFDINGENYKSIYG